MGNTYKRKVKKSMGLVSSPITTTSPLTTFSVFLTVTIISFELSAVPQLPLEEQDSQALDRIVFIKAKEALTSVTVPFSVIIIYFSFIRQQYSQSGWFDMPVQYSGCFEVQVVWFVLQESDLSCL